VTLSLPKHVMGSSPIAAHSRRAHSRATIHFPVTDQYWSYGR